MIGSFSRIPYTQFAGALAPVALVGLVLTVALIALLHRGGVSPARATSTRRRRGCGSNRVLMWRALAATGAGDRAVLRRRSRRPRRRSSSARCCC